MKWFRIISWQMAIAIAVALIAYGLGGKEAGISAILAGLCCIVPNVVFVTGLGLSDKIQDARTRVRIFFVLQFIKILLIMTLVGTALWFYKDVNWLSFLVGLAITLKSYIFLLSRSKN